MVDAPFGKYPSPQFGKVSIPDDVADGSSLCILDKFETYGDNLPIYALFAKKKRVLHTDFGWIIEYEENCDLVCLRDVEPPAPKAAAPRKKRPKKDTQTGEPSASHNVSLLNYYVFF